MSKLMVLIVLLFCTAANGQKIFLYPRVAVAPRGTYQSVTAIVTGINDRRVKWTASGAKLVGADSCAVDEPCTIAIVSTTPGKYTLTATSSVDQSLSATAEVTFTESPHPVTTHPRLTMTADMLPRLREKAVAKNLMYENLKLMATTYLQQDEKIWSWTCRGGSGRPSSDQVQRYREEDGFIFAVMSEIAPTKRERDEWGCYGRDVFMTTAGYVLSGELNLNKGNRWADGARAFSLTADLLLGGDYLSASDQTTVRAYLAKLAYEQITDIYNGALAVIGNYDSAAQLMQADENSSTAMRAMGNNYTHARILILTAAALTFNDNTTDDPPLANTCNATRYQVCPDGTAGSLHAYWRYVSGGMLYKDWADMEDANVVQPAYNAAFHNMPSQPACNTLWHRRIPCFGQGRGGEPNEGTGYGASTEKLRWALNAIHTAGYDDPLLYGPQMSMGTMSFWDLRYVADISELLGRSGLSSEKSRWSFLTDGDTLFYFAYPGMYATESGMLSADSYVGRTDRSAPLEWLVMNTAFGGPNGRLPGCTEYCGLGNELSNDYGSRVALDLFISLPAGDPTVALTTDPRTSLPTDWFDAGNQHIVVRDGGWTTGANTILSYYCTNTQIDHEHQYCGRFDIYSHGEYITKGRMEFNDYNNEMSTARNQNLPALINNPTQTGCSYKSGCYFADSTMLGGQLWHGYQAGLNTLYHSELPGYVATVADSTNSYNGGWGGFGELNQITGASRSLVYLRNQNVVVYYDRGDSGSNSLEKANYLVTTGKPSFNGNTASWLTRSGNQKVYWTELEPSGNPPALDTVYTDARAKDDWEIYGRLKADAGSVPSARFLSVLQWGAVKSSPPAPATVISTAGKKYEGALVGSSLVMFMRDRSANFTTMTYAASGATMDYIMDLAPNMPYAVSGSGVPQRVTADNAGVLAFHADGQGSITVTRIHQENLK